MTKPNFTDNNGIAIGGYDPVAYFSGAATEGNASFTATHGGATYRFATEANRDTFKADPEKYAPEYGGYCATAMSEGTIFESDPTNFKVTDGRVFLFYRGEDGDTLPEWDADEDNRRTAADKHWSEETYSLHA